MHALELLRPHLLSLDHDVYHLQLAFLDSAQVPVVLEGDHGVDRESLQQLEVGVLSHRVLPNHGYVH